MTAELASIKAGHLPAAYAAARAALAECSRLDECQDWADKAAALAVYARQAEDMTLVNHAMRIQARAIRRCGELLSTVPVAHGANQNIQDGAVLKVTREQFATDAGLSERQRKTALRVAAIDATIFDALVESDSPPTITVLAKKGTRERPPGAPWPAPSPAPSPASAASSASPSAGGGRDVDEQRLAAAIEAATLQWIKLGKFIPDDLERFYNSEEVEKLLKALGRQSDQMKRLMSVFVHAEVTRQVEAAIGERERAIDEAQAEVFYAELEKRLVDVMNKQNEWPLLGIAKWMTLDDFKLVLGCLHPDREATAERKVEAFQIFNRLKASVDPRTAIDTLRQQGWARHSSRYKPPHPERK